MISGNLFSTYLKYKMIEFKTLNDFVSYVNMWDGKNFIFENRDVRFTERFWLDLITRYPLFWKNFVHFMNNDQIKKDKMNNLLAKNLAFYILEKNEEKIFDFNKEKLIFSWRVIL